MGSWRVAVEYLKIWWIWVMFLQELCPVVVLGKEGPHFVTASAHIWMIWPKLTEKPESLYKTEKEICSRGETWAKSLIP